MEENRITPYSRRDMLKSVSCGFGMLAVGCRACAPRRRGGAPGARVQSPTRRLGVGRHALRFRLPLTDALPVPVVLGQRIPRDRAAAGRSDPREAGAAVADAGRTA